MKILRRLGWALLERLTPLPAPALAALALAAILSPVAARAQSLDVQIATDKGNQAVYQPGDAMQVSASVNADAFLLVYEIDSDGFVHVLYPMQGQGGHAPAGSSIVIPDAHSNQALVVENNTGQDYIVAIASRVPFQAMPWYLRPYDAQADAMGYVNQPQADEEGVTTDGRIVGDPFVAMERIRRRVLADPTDPTSFATAYTTYYVHEQVQYPRYICADCHRPGHWAWWDGWDPYYSTCSAVSFHVNWSWVWGPSYWYGTVPYYVYAYRPGCAPQWRWPGAGWVSSWDGWNRWNQYWNGGLVRSKTPPPMGYRSPAGYPDWHRGSSPAPPGILVTGRNFHTPVSPGAPDASLASRTVGAARQPATHAPAEPGAGRTVEPAGGPQAGRVPATPGGGSQGGDVYLHPGRTVQRGAWSPWATPNGQRMWRGSNGPIVTVRPGGTRVGGGRMAPQGGGGGAHPMHMGGGGGGMHGGAARGGH